MDSDFCKRKNIRKPTDRREEMKNNRIGMEEAFSSVEKAQIKRDFEQRTFRNGKILVRKIPGWVRAEKMHEQNREVDLHPLAADD